MLPLWAKVNLGAIAMKRYSAYPKFPALLEPCHQIIWSHIRTLARTYLSAEIQLVYSTAHANLAYLIKDLNLVYNFGYGTTYIFYVYITYCNPTKIVHHNEFFYFIKAIQGAYDMFPDFFVWAFKILIDSWKFTMLLLYILWDDWPIFIISGSNQQLQQQLEYTLLKTDCHSCWISKIQSDT